MGYTGRRNRFNYCCTTCGTMQSIPRRAFDRASRPRCMACGGYGLEATNAEARWRIKRMQGEAKIRRAIIEQKQSGEKVGE